MFRRIIIVMELFYINSKKRNNYKTTRVLDKGRIFRTCLYVGLEFLQNLSSVHSFQEHIFYT